MLYQRNRKLDSLFREQSVSNFQKVQMSHGAVLTSIRDTLQSQYSVANLIFWSLGDITPIGYRQIEPVLISAFHKNIFLFYSAIDLTGKGFYGPARTLLRSIFESLILAKYCSISNDTGLFNKWSRGLQVYITNDVFNKLESPRVDEFRIFWKSLNVLAHATIYAQQVSIEYTRIKHEISLNYSIIQLLLDCNHHLMSRHWINSSIIWYSRRYGDARALDEARAEARDCIKNARKLFTQSSKRLVLDYSKKWVLKGR